VRGTPRPVRAAARATGPLGARWYNRAASMAKRGVRARAALLLPLLAVAGPLRAGTITGKVEMVDRGGRKATDLSDVVVYVEGTRLKPRPATATMVMKGKAFTPRVAVVPVGGTVQFPNEDPIFHNAFSVSGENRFDLELYKRPKVGSATFQHPGIVRVYCNIHPQMSAVVVVRDNPLFTKAAADGSFMIENVPAGKYTVKAWNERAGEAAAEVSVPEKGEVSARFALDASTYKTVPHKNKFGKDYSAGEKY
jgi:plastocyanin